MNQPIFKDDLHPATDVGELPTTSVGQTHDPVEPDSATSLEARGEDPVPLPGYLEEVYHWAYLSQAGRRVFDNAWVVNTILWGNMGRLTQAVIEELSPDDRVLQPACVYGDFSVNLARHLRAGGELVVSDVAQVQVKDATRKLQAFDNASVILADASRPRGGSYDKVVCFFLLHEVPQAYKRQIVDGLLGVLRNGGKLVFVDYHSPSAWHPLKPLMGLIFDRLEPFAKALWRQEISEFASTPQTYHWQKEVFFGGLYQKVVVQAATGAVGTPRLDF